jgi:hypothetical protein
MAQRLSSPVATGPSKVTIDILHHPPRGLPAPEGWEIIQRNWRVWITERGSRIVRRDAVHYSMLLATCCGHETLQAPTTQFLVQPTEPSASCRSQQDADRQHYVHWSRHILANIRKVTDVELVIASWPQVPALLLGIPAVLRRQIEQAAAHRPGVWVLW